MIRNLAIIAHVDHGKTTLVDQMLRQAGAFRANQQVEERVMDSNPLERERGITILAKNTAVRWGGVKINIVDTPGPRRLRRRGRADPADGGRRADPGGRGRRADAADPVRHPEGARARPPAHRRHQQDRPRRRRAAPGARRGAGAVHRSRGDPRAARRPVPLYVEPRGHRDARSWSTPGTDLEPLFQAILDHVPEPKGDPEGPFQMLVSTLDFSSFLGRIAIGRIERGRVKVGDQVALLPLGEPGLVAEERCRAEPGHQALHLRRPRPGRGGARRPRATSWRSPASRASRSARPSRRSERPERLAGHRGGRAHHLGGLHREQRARSPAGKGSTSPAVSSRTACTGSWSATWRSGSRRPTAPTPTPSPAAASCTSAS